MMQVAGELCELGPSTLLLTFLLFLTDLSIVFIKVASHLLVLRLHVLQVLLARIEIVLPTTTVVSTVAIGDKMNSLLDKDACLAVSSTCDPDFDFD